ncbi:hypothetical protein GCM10010197_04770 [Nocardioides luteus]|uniref:Uncharacterized protein n=1 Tax=Nocardioides luteus TaxID=1844 RepID=A0ABQ5T0T8_9ACTN|nr:hypothetical protein GCM10010197_04770 [Nocardioides luteus]GLJ69701.1 hypothetical protein GCM10017579_37370 [Nocardioides luteus]
MPRDGGPDGVLVLGVAYVAGQAGHPWVVREGGMEAVGVAGVGDDAPPALQERLGQGEPEAGGTTGDDGYFVV